MAKIDKLLSSMVGRGAPVLRLDPGDVPVLELPGGHRTTLNNQELLGTQLDGLAKEILPADLETTYLRGDKVSFDYVFEGERFQVLAIRTNLGTRLVVGRAGPAGKAGGVGQEVGTKALGKMETAIQRLLKEGASDLYLNTDEPPVLRLDGRLVAMADIAPIGAKDLSDLVRPWMPTKTQEAFQGGLDVEFSHVDPALPCRVRLSLFHDANGPSAAIRVIPRQVPDADTLGLGEPVRRLASLNKGLVLLTGPMGSGKTTTLACLVEMALRARKDFVVSIHDAIEFEFGTSGGTVRQREVGRDLGRQHNALRSALRQAPDILVVDELRDPEAVDLVLQAAHAGQVVFATLQTTSIVDTLAFLVDGFPRERQPVVRTRLAGCLKAIVGHTLLRRPSGGRAAALESLFTTPAIAEHIREDRLTEVPAAMKQGRYGQVTHNEALVQLIQRGTIEPMEAYLKCQERDSFIAACKKASVDFDPRQEGAVTTDV